MKRIDAERIAATITREQLASMFERAKQSIADWKAPCPLNHQLSMGKVWNIMFPLFASGSQIRPQAMINMVRVFGEWLDDDLRPAKKIKPKRGIQCHHEEPIFEVKP